jgi:hypothetical protein
MRRFIVNLIKLLFISACIIFATTAVAKDAAPLNATTEYAFVGHLGELDADGRLLAWKGTVSGDIKGVIRWWMVVPFSYTGQVTHFVEKWEIWDETDSFLLLEGYNAGTTTNRPGKTGVWRSNGIVTYVNPNIPGLAEWFGRHMHESGEFSWIVHGEFPSHGTGIFRTN